MFSLTAQFVPQVSLSLFFVQALIFVAVVALLHLLRAEQPKPEATAADLWTDVKSKLSMFYERLKIDDSGGR